MKRPKTLSATFVERARQPGRYGDGRGSFGLSLLVKSMSNGRVSKSWSQRLRLPGRVTNIGLGAYPIVSLAEARRAALENRRALHRGENPFAGGGVPSFAEAAESVIRTHRAAWKDGAKSEAQWRASLRDYVLPKLGRMPVDRVTTGDVVGVLKPIWVSKHETARRVRSRIGAVMKWSVAEGHRADNPAGDAAVEALPKVNGIKKNMRALPHSEVAAALETVAATGAWLGSKLAFRFLVLTAARSGEVRLARWSEVDLAGKVWTVPASRMKAKKAHAVPLSDAALAVLAAAARLRDKSDLIFPSVRGRTLSDSTISKLIRENGIKAVVHGFRSSFRDWAAESGVRREVAEAALAHTIGGVEGAYHRTTQFQARREVMQQWADYLAGLLK